MGVLIQKILFVITLYNHQTRSNKILSHWIVFDAAAARSGRVTAAYSSRRLFLCMMQWLLVLILHGAALRMLLQVKLHLERALAVRACVAALVDVRALEVLQCSRLRLELHQAVTAQPLVLAQRLHARFRRARLPLRLHRHFRCRERRVKCRVVRRREVL